MDERCWNAGFFSKAARGVAAIPHELSRVNRCEQEIRLSVCGQLVRGTETGCEHSRYSNSSTHDFTADLRRLRFSRAEQQRRAHRGPDENVAFARAASHAGVRVGEEALQDLRVLLDPLRARAQAVRWRRW